MRLTLSVENCFSPIDHFGESRFIKIARYQFFDPKIISSTKKFVSAAITALVLLILWGLKVYDFIRALTEWGKKFHQVHFLWYNSLFVLEINNMISLHKIWNLGMLIRTQALGQWNFVPRISFGCFIRFLHGKLNILWFWKISMLSIIYLSDLFQVSI